MVGYKDIYRYCAMYKQLLGVFTTGLYDLGTKQADILTSLWIDPQKMLV